MFQLFRLLCCPLAFALLHVSASAQIYADFAIAEGGSPLGTFRVVLHHERAPRPVANFIGLATGARNWISPETGAVH